MEFVQYSTYSIQDFLEDDHFISFVIKPDEESKKFWAAFSEQYPEKKETVDKAAALVTAYRKQNFFSNAQNQQAVWLRIQSNLQDQPVPVQKITWFYKYMRVAAILLLISGIGMAAWLLNSTGTQTILTAYGELRTITLPDQSTVVLNGNTKLSYAKNWGKGPREVWITGEGFFNVKHLNKNQRHITPAERFIVHCNDVNIEVLGTTFNVRNRHNKTNVGLVSGKIRLDYTDSVSKFNSSLILKPGDYIEYAKKHLIAKRKLAEPQSLTVWTSHQLSFSNASLAQITEVIADDYGYHVTYMDTALAELRIEGEINVTNVKELLETISTTLHVKVVQSDKNITITNFSKP